MMRNAMRQGFTLLEVLVTLILLGILVAVVFPVVTQQIDDADPTKAGNDLANIRTGIEIFHLNVRPTYPGDLEDLAHAISTADETIKNANYSSTQTTKWNGPYVDASLAEGLAVADSISTGYGASIQSQFVRYDAANDVEETGSGYTNAEWVAVVGTGLTSDQATAINDLIDGENEASKLSSGKIRFNAKNTDSENKLYYLAVPIK